jgi:hypothetical protein
LFSLYAVDSPQQSNSSRTSFVIMALPSAIFLAVLGAGIAVTYVLSKSVSRSGRRAPLPPGPKDLPLLGNVNDLPPGGTYEAHHWLKHKDLYGTAMVASSQSGCS